MTISLASGCMNRAATLRMVLPTWLACREIDEVVVVDWSSRVPISEELADFKDFRIRFIRVEGQPYWCAARCHNVEIIAASGDNLLRIDSDVQVLPNFFREHPLEQDDIFWNASWKNSCGDDCHLFGTVYTQRKNFLLVNGYNERLQSYGFEDEDIYRRMQGAHIRRCEANRKLLKHIPHDMPSRLCHINPEFAAATNMQGIEINLKISEGIPWSAETDHMTEWDIVRSAANLWIYKQRVSPCTTT